MPEASAHRVQNNAKNPAAQLRKFGLIILVAGFTLAALIWILFPDQPQTEGNSLASQYYKRNELLTQRLWGGNGSMTLELTRAFQRPSTYALILLGASVVIALVCFYLASHPPRHIEKKMEQ